MNVYIVRQGDTLEDIATGQLGCACRSQDIIFANPHVPHRRLQDGSLDFDPRCFFEGAAIYLPSRQGGCRCTSACGGMLAGPGGKGWTLQDSVALHIGLLGSAMSSGENGEGRSEEDVEVGVTPVGGGFTTPSKAGKPCPRPASVPIKPLLWYTIHDNIMPGYVSQEFGLVDPRLSELNAANYDDPNGFVTNNQGICVMKGWQDGIEIRIPASWPDAIDPNNPHIRIGVGTGSTGEGTGETGFPMWLGVGLGIAAAVAGTVGVAHLLKKRRARST